MADWKTYAKAARNTAKKQAPGVKQAAQRSVDDAGRRTRDYATAARNTLDKQAPGARESARATVDRSREYARSSQQRLRKVEIVPTLLRALREALLIGGSLFAIWGVLYLAGIPIPFTTVLIIVGVVVVFAFGGTVYAKFQRQREAAAEPADPAEGDLDDDASAPPRSRQ
ncbi:MAG TPA: hypothetical protein H9837_12770 [Candidatus Brachybacterium merdigallinarum]|nr:hypothetical protein [Candidatus Brachybacterium merdigallinarum]